MPVFELTEEIAFPPPEWSNPDGILAIGGDLQPERLLLAYQMGIFPWYSRHEPIIWWSPDPRFVLRAAELKIPKSMRPVLNQAQFQVTYDQAFREIISQCKKIRRKGQPGTWITDAMLEGYYRLFEMGYAHSVEVWQHNVLAGGLYGVSLGNCFFGESMFATVTNASKAGFITLIQDLQGKNFDLIDCQVYTSHLAQFGAENIPRKIFLDLLKTGLEAKTIQGNWGDIFGRTNA